MKIALLLTVLFLGMVILVTETGPPPTFERIDGKVTRWNEVYGDGRDNAVEGVSYDLVAAVDTVYEAINPPVSRKAFDLIVWVALFPSLLIGVTAWAFRKLP